MPDMLNAPPTAPPGAPLTDGASNDNGGAKSRFDATTRTLQDGSPMPSTPIPDLSPAAALCLDAQSLARLQELDPQGENKLLERVIAAYVKSLERLLPELANARRGELDLNQVRHVSHTLKSSSASLGALSLSERCAEIETMARLGETAGLEAKLDGMLMEVTQVRQALLSLLPHTP
jgi:HPt (histidine-containing phosphotransfer) domain-containing protein